MAQQAEVVDLSVDGADDDDVDANAVISSLATRWLPYEREIVEELYAQDGVLVLGRGLGLLRVLASFVRLYCSPRSLVLCLNANEQAATLRRLVLALGLDRRLLPRVVDARINLNERQQMYKRGGVFFVTARILVVDLLSNHVDPGTISGLLVNDAHHVTETSIEAFILRLYRERNREGFIKGFCGDSVALSSGFNRVEQVLKHLYVRDVFLYPRFHVAIHSCLEKYQPEVYEIEVAFSPSMKTMQEALLVALEATVKELQRSTKSLDAADLTMDKALARSFSSFIRRQLDPLWHKLPVKTKQLVGDLATLRQLLAYIPRYDAISYYSFLVNYQTMNGQQRFPSPWLFTDAADRLLTAAKERIYQVVDSTTKKPVNPRQFAANSNAVDRAELKLVLEQNPKWDALKEILDEVHDEQQREQQKKKNNDKDKLAAGGASILVMVKDERTCAQLREFLSLGAQEMMRRRFGHYLLQKEATLKQKGGKMASLGLEQRLLLEAAAKLKTDELYTEEETVLSSESKGKQKSGAAPGKTKKRVREDSSETSYSDVQVHTTEVSSFGLSAAELETITAATERAEKDGKSKAFFDGRLRTASNRRDEQSGTSNLSLEVVDPQDSVVLCTYEQATQHGYGASAFLEDLMPSCIILYDPDMGFVREVEVFHASHVAPLEIYFMMYDESTEQQSYLSEIQREKRAFDKLIHQKAHLMMPANVYDLPLHMKLRQQTMEYSMDTRTGGRAKSHRAGVKVVVDVREFRSALPSMLHKEGLFVLPVTLEIGDYILSPEICVERKSISDLFGSLNSGRLFNQAESMRRFYKTPVLLIEFTQGKAFSLQDVSELGSEISATNIVSKLTLLILHYPSLRILWSRSPHATVDLFKIIKKYQDEPDMEAAAALGNGLPMDDSGAQNNSGEGKLASNYYNTSSIDVLKKLPGINEHNFRKVLTSVKNLADLSRQSLDELTELLGKANGKKLHTFFNSTA
ncbi:DNA repair endonuclease [Phytophthora fragariae]|uniref:DNA repair endonuclease n=2 Tax=Phytophthora fragariae TaxID=53985 RepID=A0A6A3KDK0_9STRA|nr:DNA repair endonuclease [Phytophthora fragariae]KAE8934572.1 DNA repair endonuclease [Phytophthora fragariae]KAE9002775.1 DNA repair endonuclease [Phytophthora fragariae]KAE9130386.1 DNA repair endonuclease [Phytophthora fragariae]KAE9141203.1 DNA repair endonuclease [Phytophthora fragariae]